MANHPTSLLSTAYNQASLFAKVGAPFPVKLIMGALGGTLRCSMVRKTRRGPRRRPLLPQPHAYLLPGLMARELWDAPQCACAKVLRTRSVTPQADLGDPKRGGVPLF